MSKNTASAAFRNVDVDELDDEQYRDEPETAGEEDEAASQVSRREQEVKKFTSRYPSLPSGPSFGGGGLGGKEVVVYRRRLCDDSP